MSGLIFAHVLQRITKKFENFELLELMGIEFFFSQILSPCNSVC